MALFAAVFALAVLVPLVVGLPIALRLCTDSKGPKIVALAVACGLSVVLITVRGAQMLMPINDSYVGIAGIWLALACAAWAQAGVRRSAAALATDHWATWTSMLVVIVGVVVVMNVPILFGDALQFEGTSNADSFTFTSSARYMLGHAFHGAADASPEHPVYAISRSYFGETATQPRPAAEGYLAWLSATLGRDPMYVYNAAQSAGWALATLSVAGFIPDTIKSAFLVRRVLAIAFTAACPAVLMVALNSNFANIYHLPVATAYVLLSLHASSAKSFTAAVLLLACLLGGYPELIPFAGACRGAALVAHAVKLRSWRTAARECVLRSLEVLVACCLVPWAALHASKVLITSMTLSAGNEALRGNLFSGLPLFVSALAAWKWSTHHRGNADGYLDNVLAGVCATFALAQCWIVYRGFDYGGFKLAQYFSTLLAGVLVASTLRTFERRRAYEACLFALAALMVYQSTVRLVKSWRVAEHRKITTDLQRAAAYADALPRGTLVAMGDSPVFFYYGMWVSYLTDARMVYDVSLKDTAGYLSPYVRLVDKTPFSSATRRLSIDPPGAASTHRPCDERSFGRVHIGACL